MSPLPWLRPRTLILLLAPLATFGSEIPYLVGSDVSALPVYEANGALYRDAAGDPGDALEILREAGSNVFRLRLFVDPVHRGIVTNDLAYTLRLAKRVRASGAFLLLNLHYSDTWADPSKQFKPKAWEHLSFDELLSQVEEYTHAVMRAFIEADLAPEFVQLGNEITNGMLWPDGLIDYAEADDAEAWDRFAALQHAAHRGFRSAFRAAGLELPSSILHIESTGNLERTRWYLDSAAERDLPYDLLGFSFYPEWHGSIADLQATLELAAEESDKPIAVVETAYPWKPGERWKTIENLDWPLTPEGQRRFLEAVDAVVRSLPDERGRGVLWWHPESILVKDLHAWLGGACALFDDEGRLLPAARAIPAASLSFPPQP